MPEFTQEQKNAIYQRGCNLLVSAAAGSGKTTVLVERVLSLLEEGIDIDRILIVTFTRAAAGDMKLKLQKRLEEKAITDERFRLQCDKLPLATIGTLHSFCSSLIREFFEAAGIDAAYRIMDESEAEKLTLDTLRDVMRDYYAQDTPELRALSCGRNAKKVTELVMGLYRFARNRPDSRDWLCRCVSVCDPDTQTEKLISILEEDARASLTEAASLYRRAFGICSEPDGPAHYRACIEGDLDAIGEMLSLSGDAFVNAIGAFSQQKAGRAKKSDEFSLEKLDTVKKLRENAKKRIASSGNRLLPTGEAQRDLRELKITLSALRDITLMLDERLTAEKDERGTYDYADLEERAIRVLRNPQARGSVLDRYDAVFVDEYQDISDMQDAIVRLTAPENALFMVGDVKQSIYRFRLAEPGLFLSRQKAFSKGEGGKL
ncbi:MAG: UvrD-helicase domain-containing protein, partial [Clostridia bacterium]|nr:UvrD-helicase domain-containing protein [Clostridia bacterium]